MGKRKRPPKPPPFGDPRWCPMQDAIEARERQTRSIPLAVTELEDEMRSGKRHSMRVNIATGVPEPLKDSLWIDHEIDVIRVAGFEPIRVYRRTRERRPGEPRRWGDIMTFDDDSRVRVEGHAYFVLDGLLGIPPTATPQRKRKRKRAAGGGARLRKPEPPPPPPAPAPTRGKPGPKPTGDWYARIEQWLRDIAHEEKQRLENIDALVIDAQKFLDEKIGWAPSEPRDLRRKIVELLPMVRSSGN